MSKRMNSAKGPGEEVSLAGGPEEGGKLVRTGKDENSGGLRERFRRGAAKVAAAVGHPAAFVIAVLTVAVWGICGPMFGYSDTWQLVINTSTTIITFLIVFLIQNTQNRDSKAIHIKLDELLRAITGARTNLVDLEDATEEELERLKKEFNRIRAEQKNEVCEERAAVK